jgi:hypothetical protein
MTVQASSRVTDVDRIDLDAPIFDPDAFRLTDETAAIIATARAWPERICRTRRSV